MIKEENHLTKRQYVHAITNTFIITKFTTRVKAPIIQKCNFGTTVEIFLQNRITLLSCDMEHHLLKALLYFDNVKCGHYIQYTQIRKEYSIQSVSCFKHKMSSQHFFSYCFKDDIFYLWEHGVLESNLWTLSFTCLTP